MLIPKISIILPVYNAEKTVSRMINSILNQTCTDWELLIIDDGSTDNSGILCDDYAANDIRIRVFHKKNEGVALARQVGVDNARGVFSIHADADDWMEANMLESMLEIAERENADIVFADFYNTYPDGKSLICNQVFPSNESIEILYQILIGNIFGALWNKLIRHSLYKKCGAMFYKDVNYMEDVLVWVKILQCTNLKICHLDKAYYHYVVNEGSITHRLDKKTYNGIIKMHEKIVDLLSDRDSRFIEYKKRLPLGVFHAGYMNYLYTDEEIKEEFKKVRRLAYKTKSIRWLLGYLMIDVGLYKIGHWFIRF